MLSLLPGDIKYESPSGRFRFYFPITTSIVISIILTLVLWLLSSRQGVLFGNTARMHPRERTRYAHRGCLECRPS